MGSKFLLFLNVFLFSLIFFSLACQLVQGEYQFVNLSYLSTHIGDYLLTEVITTGVARLDIFSIPEQPGNVFLQSCSLEGLEGVWLFIDWNWLPQNGTMITVYGIVLFEMMGYYISVDFYDYGPLWNIADVNNDLKVNIFDAVLVAISYDSTPSDSHWNCCCDIAEPYGIINMQDVVLMAQSYGEEYSL